MKIKSTFFILPFFLILLYCNSQVNFPRDEKKIENLINSYSASFDNKDFEDFVQYCSESFKFYTLDGKVFDKNTLAKFLVKIMSRWGNLNSEISDLEIQVDNKLAFARYRQKVTYVSGTRNGEMNNLITATFLKINSNWKLAHFHMSSGY